MLLSKEAYEKIVSAYRGNDILADISDELIPLWCDDYCANNPGAELVLVEVAEPATSFQYLFDIPSQRNVVAFGIPAFSKHARDASRMAGHPLSSGGQFHRGHLMAHSIGGGTDINLVPQLGKLNIGQFRVLERKVRDLARQNLRSFYFVRTIYESGSQPQTPRLFEQCVLLPSRQIFYSMHNNW